MYRVRKMLCLLSPPCGEVPFHPIIRRKIPRPSPKERVETKIGAAKRLAAPIDIEGDKSLPEGLLVPEVGRGDDV